MRACTTTANRRPSPAPCFLSPCPQTPYSDLWQQRAASLAHAVHTNRRTPLVYDTGRVLVNRHHLKAGRTVQPVLTTPDHTVHMHGQRSSPAQCSTHPHTLHCECPTLPPPACTAHTPHLTHASPFPHATCVPYLSHAPPHSPRNTRPSPLFLGSPTTCSSIDPAPD